MTQIKAAAVLYAKDNQRLADFYKTMAALVICDSDKTHVRLESDAFQLVILQAPERIADAIEITEPPQQRDGTPIKLVFFVDSINKSRDLAKQLGGDVGVEKDWKFDGYTLCDGYDPEGNIFQLRASS